MLLAVEARRRLDTPETRTALLDVLRYNLPPDVPVRRRHATSAADVRRLPAGLATCRLLRTSTSAVMVVCSPPAGVTTAPASVVVVYDTTTRREIGRIGAQCAAHAVRWTSAMTAATCSSTTFERSRTCSTPQTATASTILVPSRAGRSITSASFRAFRRPVRHHDGGRCHHAVGPSDRPQGRRARCRRPPPDVAGFATDGTLAIGHADFSDPDDLRPQVQFWDVDQRRRAKDGRPRQPASTFPTQFTFSPDMRYLAGAADGSMVVWDLTTGQILGGPAGRPSTASAVIFTADHTVSTGDRSHRRGDAALRRRGRPNRSRRRTERRVGHRRPRRERHWRRARRARPAQGAVAMWRDAGSRPAACGTIDCCTSEPTWSVLGDHVLAETDDAFVVHDTSRPEEPGVVIDDLSTGRPRPRSTRGECRRIGRARLGARRRRPERVRHGPHVGRAVGSPGRLRLASATLSADGTRIATMSTDYRTLELLGCRSGRARSPKRPRLPARLRHRVLRPAALHCMDGSAIDVRDDSTASPGLDADDLTVMSFGQAPIASSFLRSSSMSREPMTSSPSWATVPWRASTCRPERSSRRNRTPRSRRPSEMSS